MKCLMAALSDFQFSTYDIGHIQRDSDGILPVKHTRGMTRTGLRNMSGKDCSKTKRLVWYASFDFCQHRPVWSNTQRQKVRRSDSFAVQKHQSGYKKRHNTKCT